ncbi:MAG: HAD family phosphatase [Verrucomicrobiaceae bacterium]|nr:MAG: HAD family phosphatase [Verrucomicrobiaceae bacterium]
MSTSRAGLFLDLDGTLADSLSVMRAAYDRFLERFGRTGSDDEFARLNGPRLAEVIKDIAGTHGIDASIADLLGTYMGLVEDAYRNVAPSAGAIDLLRTAQAHDMTIGVVTSNTETLTRTWLRTVGLFPMVHIIVSGDDIKCGKPDPEPYLKALSQSGCEASISLAVEDSILGARSAVAAGIPTLLLSGSPLAITLEATVIDHLDRVAELLAGRKLMTGEHR